MKKLVKGKRGITLIALVITIIVLLILAGVSIAMLTGENGVIRKAQDAKERTINSTIAEQDQLNLILEGLNQDNEIETAKIEITERNSDNIKVKIDNSELKDYQFSLDGKKWSEPQELNEYTFKNLTEVIVDESNYKIKTGTKYTIYAKAKTNNDKEINCQPIETSTAVRVIGNPDYFEYEESEYEVTIMGLKEDTILPEKICSSKEELVENLNKIKMIPSYINGKPVAKINQNLLLQCVSKPIFLQKAKIYLIYKGEGDKNDIVMNGNNYDLETGQLDNMYYWREGLYNLYSVCGNLYDFQEIRGGEIEKFTFDYKILPAEIVIPPTVKEFIYGEIGDSEETPNMVNWVYDNDSPHFTILGKKNIKEIWCYGVFEDIILRKTGAKIEYID